MSLKHGVKFVEMLGKMGKYKPTNIKKYKYTVCFSFGEPCVTVYNYIYIYTINLSFTEEFASVSIAYRRDEIALRGGLSPSLGGGGSVWGLGLELGLGL